jgi:hypothetical protein
MAWSKKNKVLALSGAFIIYLIISAAFLWNLADYLRPDTSNVNKPVRDIRNIRLAGNSLSVEVVSTPGGLYQGLSGRKSLCPDCGMLFNFSDESERDFVMRNMEFPLDIIFIDQDEVKSISAAASPEGPRPTKIYSSVGPARQVLEVNAGYCASHDIKPGDRIELSQ